MLIMIHHLRFTLSLVFASLAMAVQAAELLTLSGKMSQGDLVAVEAQQIVFRDSETKELLRFPIQSLATITYDSAIKMPAEFDAIELTDGSELRIRSYTIPNKSVLIELAAEVAEDKKPGFTIPLPTLFWTMRESHITENRKAWETFLSTRGKRDLFVIRQATGLNQLAGTILSGNDEGTRINFEREDGIEATLPLSRATGGLVYNQPVKPIIPPTLCRVFDIYGNVLFAASIEIDRESWTIGTVAGATVKYPSGSSIAKLDFRRGNISYLSDLVAQADYPEPISAGPLGNVFPINYKVQADRGIPYSTIIFAGQAYDKGVTVPVDSAVTYSLNRDYRSFKALAGLHDRLKPETCELTLTVEIDGKVAYSETISKAKPPVPITLNVKDASTLTIRVTSKGLFEGNQINLADARLQK